MANADSGSETKVDLKLWLNGLKCVGATDEFCAGIGRDIVEELMRAGRVENWTPEMGAPYKITVEVTAS